MAALAPIAEGNVEILGLMRDTAMNRSTGAPRPSTKIQRRFSTAEAGASGGCCSLYLRRGDTLWNALVGGLFAEDVLDIGKLQQSHHEICRTITDVSATEMDSKIHRQFRNAHEGHKSHAGLDPTRGLYSCRNLLDIF